jgi:serine/threonine-protein kinase
MGEVYRARDTRLNRDVALKVLPDAVQLDADRLARFKREAQVLAALNHPHIGAIYGLEESSGGQALVLELVEGATLADRLQRGAMRIEDALPIACQIAEALESAHEQGIVHRDLKPANIKLAADNRVKVLDFGLAKAMEKTPASATVANSPTLSVLATQAGIIMGTAAYMSPEQAKGADTDRRSDIFSFGVVLYEMLTARQPFHGETAAELMASVLIRDADLDALPANLHPRIRELITRCLEKQPKKRWQAMGDLRLELESLAAAPYRAEAPSAVVAPRHPLWKHALAVAFGVVLTAAASPLVARWFSTPRPAPVVRFSFPSQDFRTGAPAVAISPDGYRIVYTGGTGADRSQLMLRNLSDADAHPISGSTIRGTIYSPVFSPDGRFVVYYASEDRGLKKLAVTGGTAVTLCTLTSVPIGGIGWYADTLFVAQAQGIIVKIPANGGEPQLVAQMTTGMTAASPHVIDDRGSLLFALGAGADLVSPGVFSRWDRAQIIVQTPDGNRHVVVSAGADPHYLPTGHLVFFQGGSLLAVPFDTAQTRIAGVPVPVIEGVARSASGAGAQASISPGGTLAYVSGPAAGTPTRTLGLIDVHDGKVHPIPIPPNSYVHPRISPDGRLAAVVTDDGKDSVVWIYDLIGRGPPRRLTFAGRSTSPIWTPDGRSVTYQSDQQGDKGLFLQRADGTGPVERLTKAEAGTEHFPDSWAPDGNVLAFRVQSATSSIWMVARDGNRTPKPLLQMKDRSQVLAQFSPDGRWIAYGSNELTGAGYQVFVKPFPPDDATKFQTETQTGSAPLWSHDGKRLFFAYSSRVFAMDVQTSPTFATSQPLEIAGTDGSLASLPAVRNFDLTPDGKQLLVVLTDQTDDRNGAAHGPQINVVLNWTEELKTRVPTK